MDMKHGHETGMSDTCEGCGKPFERAYGYNTRPIVASVEIAPDVTVNVCGSTHNNALYYRPMDGYAPKLSCLRKAFETHSACPGCGTEHSRGERGPYDAVCDNCRDTLIRARDTLGDKPGSYCLDTSLITEQYPSDRASECPDGAPTPSQCVDELLDTIVRIAAANGPRHSGRDVEWGAVLGADHRSAHSGMPRVELDDGQRVAVEELGSAIRKLTQAMYHQGRRAGRNLLGGLATGEYTIREFEERQKYWSDEEDGD